MRIMLLGVLLISGCVMVRPGSRMGGSGDAVPVGGVTGTEGRLPRTPAGSWEWPAENTEFDRPNMRTKHICRTEGVPGGWVITAYESVEGRCPKSADRNVYNVAVIETLMGYERGAVISICADQKIPANWMLESDDRQTASCPGARVRDNQRTALVIYKTRM